MTARDRSLAVLVAVLWGLNFLAVRVGLDHFPPFFLAALRYLVLAVPVVLFVPRPGVRLRWLLGYGLGFGVAQFGLLFLAIEQGMPSGLASVVVQASAPFTVLLGALLLRERVTGRQLGGIGLAVAGMAVIAVDRARTAPLLPLVLTVLAALGWAVGNLASRQAKPEYPLRFALWMAVIPPLPLLALSAVMEGPATGWRALGSAFTPDGWPGLVALVYIAVLGSVVGSGIWTALLKRYPAGVVAPFSMLVPVVGMAGAWLALHERPTGWALAGAIAVVAGVLLGTGWLPRFLRDRNSTTAAPRQPEGRGGRPPGGQPAGATGASQETRRS
ncbi:EamA family transporter [Streptomyces sp. NPDC057428]|uniref:EamA family transporter n=1 Tax=Streptomyces sp. NPDC057428 TaxID=3346129 RepID=UPI0036C36A5C